MAETTKTISIQEEKFIETSNSIVSGNNTNNINNNKTNSTNVTKKKEENKKGNEIQGDAGESFGSGMMEQIKEHKDLLIKIGIGVGVLIAIIIVFKFFIRIHRILNKPTKH